MERFLNGEDPYPKKTAEDEQEYHEWNETDKLDYKKKEKREYERFTEGIKGKLEQMQKALRNT